MRRPLEYSRTVVLFRLNLTPFWCFSCHAGPTGQVKHCGFVLVAGGLGERLGYGDIKLRLPSETCTMTTYLQLYIGQILHLQER